MEFEWKEVAGDEVDFAEKLEFTTVMAKPLRPRLGFKKFLRVMRRGRSGFAMTVVNSRFSANSTSSPSTSFHSNSITIDPTKYSRCSMAMLSPAQILRPTPNGIILIPLVPCMSTPTPWPPSKNRSGTNSIAFSHSLSNIEIFNGSDVDPSVHFLRKSNRDRDDGIKHN
uniref:Uncharacterized protein n=1 Tax=Oryza punctata TaxID=4537 RepID=A0A0E0M9Q0_ORYPU